MNKFLATLKLQWEHLVTKEKALFKSATVYVAAVIGSLPDMLTFADANFPQVSKFLPAALHDPVMRWIGAAVFLARLRSMVKLPPPTVTVPGPTGPAPIPPAAIFAALALALLLASGVAHATGPSTTVSWTDPTTYVDGTPLPSTDIGFVTVSWTRPGSATVLGTLKVSSGLTVVVSGLVCGSYAITVTVTSSATAAGYPNTTSDPTNPVTYVTGIGCKPNPATGVAATP